MKIAIACCFALSVGPGCSSEPDRQSPLASWVHLSTVSGDLEIPNSGNQQTATALFDVDQDGTIDFLIAERTAAPSLVWYRREAEAWSRHVVDAEALHIEAGSAVCDIDRDGDLDVVFGGDFRSNRVWWWENPYPVFNPEIPWTRHVIKNTGLPKHHDQIVGDFDGDGREELVFWNQTSYRLYLAEIPDEPRGLDSWPLRVIYQYDGSGEVPQRGEYPGWKGTNEHEGLAACDIDGDGVLDVLGGGRWFRHEGEGVYSVHLIDEAYAFSRVAAGQLIPGGRPEVLLVVGDGRAPLVVYEWSDERWNARVLVETVQDGHSLSICDFDGNGFLDVFVAEMRLGANADAKTRVLLGDGSGSFSELLVVKGFGLHESAIADLDGDGDLDILGKPYTWEAPRLDIWINQSKDPEGGRTPTEAARPR